MSAPEITWEALRHAVDVIARERSEWAGLPLPIDGHELILEPHFPYQLDKQTEEPESGVVNEWFSAKQKRIIIIERHQGKVRAVKLPAGNRNTATLLGSLGACHVWPMEAEVKALTKLQTMVSDWKFKCYFLTGSFMETSTRSEVTYIFRRLRPTIALSSRGNEVKILCALCLHPIGYYSETWAGVMVPTDDVIAHLSLMRGDEHLFWKRANQIEPWWPTAGI